MIVPPIKTPYTEPEILAALTAAYVAQLGHPPSRKMLAIVAAQCALECANGSACVQFNIGCYKAGVGPDTCSFTTTEWLGDPPVEHQMVCSFSAWHTLEAAAEFVIRSLYLNYPAAWSAAVLGDSDGYVAGLRAEGYFTAPLVQYQAGVRRWVTHYLPLIPPDPVDDTQPMTPLDASALAGEALALADTEPAPPDMDT